MDYNAPVICLDCGKEVEQSLKGRPKNFCNVSCRSNHWQKEQRKMAKLYKFKPIKSTTVEIASNEVYYEMGKLYELPISDNEIKIETTNGEDILRHEIQKQITAIQNEKIPPERNVSRIGRQSWELDREKRIAELKKQLQ